MKRVSPRTIIINILVAAGSVGYAVFEHRAWPRSTNGIAVTLIGSAVDTLSSPSFIAFVLVTAWLMYCIVDVRVSRQIPRLVRLGSYLGLVGDVARRGAQHLLATGTTVVLATSIAPLLIEGSGSDPVGAEPVTIFTAAGIHPVVALLCQVALLFVFFLTVRVLVEVVVLIGGLPVAVGFCAALWIWSAASAAGFVDSPLVDVRSYTVLVAILSYPIVAVTVASTYVVLAASLAASARLLDLSARDRLPTLPRLFAPSVAAFGFILFATVSMQTAVTDVQTHLVALFFGAGGTVLQMLIAVVLIVGYVLVVQQRVGQELDGWSTLTLIRHGSQGRLVASIVRTEALAAGAYSLVLLSSAIAAYVLAGGRDLALRVDAMTLLLIYQLVVVQFLQLTFCIACVVAVTLLSRSPIAGLATVGVFAALSAVPIPADAPVPVQRSTSAILYNGGWDAAVINTAVLMILTGAAVTIAATRHPYPTKSGTDPARREVPTP